VLDFSRGGVQHEQQLAAIDLRAALDFHLRPQPACGALI
jgi:hypothetical protein